MPQLPTEWKHFGASGRSVEGRYIPSHASSGDLILFVPGFPGNGATLFERSHSDRLQQEEYSQIILRHNGTRLDSESASEFLNTTQFPKAIPYHDGNWIGGKPSTLAEWLLEPKTVLEEIVSAYTNVTIVAHSFGSMATLHSLCLLAEEGFPFLDRIKTCLCMAPALGLLKDHAPDVMDTLWTDQFINDPHHAEKIALGNLETFRSEIETVLKDLPDRVARNLQKIAKVFVHVERDEYIRYEDVDEFMKSCGQNSYFCLDKFNRHDPRTGYDAHDMPNLPTQFLLDLIDGSYHSMKENPPVSDGFDE